MATSKQQSLATISAATRALAEATTPEQTQAVAAMSEAAMAWAKASGDYDLLVEAKRVHIRARFRTVELVRPLMPGRGGDRGANQHGKRQTDNVIPLPAPKDVLAQVGLTEADWTNLLTEWRELKGTDGKLREDLLSAYLDGLAEEGEDPTTAGLLRYVAESKGKKPPEPAKGKTDFDKANEALLAFDKAVDGIRHYSEGASNQVLRDKQAHLKSLRNGMAERLAALDVGIASFKPLIKGGAK